jgi:hypothetical protein
MIFFIEQFVLHRKLHNLPGILLLLQIAASIGIMVTTALFLCVLLFPGFGKTEEMIKKFIKTKKGPVEIGQIISEQPFLIVSLVFIVYFIKNIFLLFGITDLNVLVVLVALLLHMFFCFLLYKPDYRQIAVPLIVSYLVIVLSLISSSAIYDYSWDGQAYHQTAVLFLSEGWNPFYFSLPTDEFILVAVNHYPKFTWIYGSLFLSLFGNIEMGKSYNILFFITMLMYAFKITNKYQKNKLAVLVFSICLAANPVVLAQMFTYYVDGLMGMLIIILFFALMDYDRNKNEGGKCLFIIVAVSIFAINIKFTGFICGMVLIGFIVKQLFQKRYKSAVCLVLSGMVILLVGVLFIGYNPYIVNLIKFGHPFYPLYGKGAVDIMTINTPENLLVTNPVRQFFSLYLLNYDWKTLPFNPLKILKLVSHRAYDLRIGGFGVFFAEISFFAFLCFFVNLFNSCLKKTNPWRDNRNEHGKIFFSACLLLFISLVMPENWWARYIPFFWYLNWLLIIPINIHHSTVKKLFYVLFLLVVINSGSFLMGNVINGLVYTRRFKNFVTEIKEYDSGNITVILNHDFFKYSIKEKLRHARVNKNISFEENEVLSFINGVYMGNIKGWR